jgi:ATPase subunit of ABC transporter with duplicated ATPase domains
MEQQEKRNVRGEKSNVNKGIGKLALDYMKDANEKTLSRTKDIHASRVQQSEEKLIAAKNSLQQTNTITIDLEKSEVPAGKKVVVADQVNYQFPDQDVLWPQPISFALSGAERLCITGDNGSGKSTLARLMTGNIRAVQGNIYVGVGHIGIIDQKLEMLEEEASILDNIRRFAPSDMAEHDLRIRLGRFLFYHESVFKKVKVLSGGERMRTALACLLATGNSPELLILDEPTNNLDLASIEQVVSALAQFTGAIIIISHDQDFLCDIGITHELHLDRFVPYKWKIL